MTFANRIESRIITDFNMFFSLWNQSCCMWHLQREICECVIKNLLEYEVVRIRAVDGSFAIGRNMFHFFSLSIWYCQKDQFGTVKRDSLPALYAHIERETEKKSKTQRFSLKWIFRMKKSSKKKSLLCKASFYCYYIDIRLAIKNRSILSTKIFNEFIETIVLSDSQCLHKPKKERRNLA